MRQTRTDQVSIFDRFSNHDIGKELKAMSVRLDRHRELLEWVVLDLHLKDVYDTGRQGLLLPEQYRGYLPLPGSSGRRQTPHQAIYTLWLLSVRKGYRHQTQVRTG